jgi:hypothetical protein
MAQLRSIVAVRDVPLPAIVIRSTREPTESPRLSNIMIALDDTAWASCWSPNAAAPVIPVAIRSSPQSLRSAWDESVQIRAPVAGLSRITSSHPFTESSSTSIAPNLDSAREFTCVQSMKPQAASKK